MANEERTEMLTQWLRRIQPDASGPFQPMTGDASFRRYFRLRTNQGDRVAMDAPPEYEDTASFIDIAERLQAAGVSAPRLLSSDSERGFLLLSDLGDRLYLDALDAASADTLYGDAIETLLRMQSDVSPAGLPSYDAGRLHAEMELFATWFLARYLGLPEREISAELSATFTMLSDAALEQPRVFVHRDYHSRNLMVLDAHGPGVLDFQDGVAGPLTYDLVSLLRDCYIAWPQARIDRWLAHYRRGAAARGIAEVPRDTLQRWFDLMGVQRHLKAIGIFTRLYLRDDKPRYLADIPRTWGYIEALFGHYPELAPLARLARRFGLVERIERPPPCRA